MQILTRRQCNILWIVTYFRHHKNLLCGKYVINHNTMSKSNSVEFHRARKPTFVLMQILKSILMHIILRIVTSRYETLVCEAQSISSVDG